LLLDDSNIIPYDLAGLRAVLTIGSMFDLELCAEEHFYLLPFVNFVKLINLFFCGDIIEDYDSSVAIVIKGVLRF